MASFTITLQQDIMNDLVNGIARRFKYDETIDGTKINFAKQKIHEYLKDIYLEEKYFVLEETRNTIIIVETNNFNSNCTVV